MVAIERGARAAEEALKLCVRKVLENFCCALTTTESAPPSRTHIFRKQPKTTILIMAILRQKRAAAKAHYASCCVMVFHVVGFSCFSLKIGEMEIFHKTHSRRVRRRQLGWVGGGLAKRREKFPLNFPHACSS